MTTSEDVSGEIESFKISGYLYMNEGFDAV